jgi:hypothetical protein
MNTATWECLTALATAGQFLVVGAAAVFAYLQLRGLRRQQEAQVVQRIFDELNCMEFATALKFVYNDLPTRLQDIDYVRDLAEGTATASSHPEMLVMHFFNELGILVHEGLVSNLIVPFVASPCLRSWSRLAPVVELMRRRYPHAYTPFESLVVRAGAVDFARINSRFRLATPRLREGWRRTADDLNRQRIGLLDNPI